MNSLKTAYVFFCELAVVNDKIFLLSYKGKTELFYNTF